MTIQDMTIQNIAITRIKRNPRNARTHPAKQIRQLADSIAAFGFRNPLLVNEDGEVIAGHGRLKAAELLGLKTVPVIVVAGLSTAKQRALAVADNRVAENAGWDRGRLAIEIPEVAELLAAEGLDVSVLGFGPIEIARLETEPAERSRRRNGMDPDGIDPRWSELPVDQDRRPVGAR
jgi:ParB-like chromosome segregation protein Spo0J